MSIIRSFMKNTSFVLFSTILENGISYLIILLLTRSLGAEGLGQYSFVFAFIGLFFIISDFGLTQLLTKELSNSRENDSKLVANVFTAKVLLGVSSSVVAILGSLLINRPELFTSLVIVALIELSRKLRMVPYSILRVNNQGLWISGTNLLERIFAFVGALVAFFYIPSLQVFLLAMLLSSIISLFLTFYAARSFTRIMLDIQKETIMPLLRRGLPYVMIAVAAFIYLRIDIVMLSFLTSDRVVGWYSAGYKIIDIISVLPHVILTFGFPAFTKLFTTNKTQLEDFFNQIVHYLVLLMVPAIFGVWLLGDRIIVALYDISAPESFFSFDILIVAGFFIMIQLLLGYLLASMEKQKEYSKIALWCAGLNIVLNFIFIPWLSLYGAAISTVITYVVLTLFLHKQVSKRLTVKIRARSFGISLFASSIMCISLVLLMQQPLYYSIPAGILIYGCSVLIFEYKNFVSWYVKYFN